MVRFLNSLKLNYQFEKELNPEKKKLFIAKLRKKVIEFSSNHDIKVLKNFMIYEI